MARRNIQVDDENSTPLPPVERTTAGLRAVLFDEIDRLRSGISTPAASNALATLCHKIGQSVLLEISVARFAAEMGLKGNKALPTSSITLNGGTPRGPQENPVQDSDAPGV